MDKRRHVELNHSGKRHCSREASQGVACKAEASSARSCVDSPPFRALSPATPPVGVLDAAAYSCLLSLPSELVSDCARFLPPESLMRVELACHRLRHLVNRRELWRLLFAAMVEKHEWRVPSACHTLKPLQWKPYYYMYRRQARLHVSEPIQDISAVIHWRVRLPPQNVAYKKRSREFSFSKDALGNEIKWRVEIDVKAPTGPPSAANQGQLAVGNGSFQSYSPYAHQHQHQHQQQQQQQQQQEVAQNAPQSQDGMVRIWTTNTWTKEMTVHYYGSHCTISLRDNLNKTPATTETVLDIDNSKQLLFDTKVLPANREILLRIHLTLALEVSASLTPFYSLISKEQSEAVQIGYCKAVFEIARYKRKHGSTFATPGDGSDVRSLVRLAGRRAGASEKLRSEAFQALFNLLSPSSVLIPSALTSELLRACFDVLTRIPAKENPDDGGVEVILVQNALGSIFNLLVHKATHRALSATVLAAIYQLLLRPKYQLCWFSAITVLLTASNWGVLPLNLRSDLSKHMETYIAANNPLDPDHTGVAWDETDIAAYFLPLLMSPSLPCVTFANWCISAYYCRGVEG